MRPLPHLRVERPTSNLQPMEVIPLFLVVRGWREAINLAILVNAACLVIVALGAYYSHVELQEVAAPVLIAGAYLPCLLMVMRRANAGEMPWLLSEPVRVARAVTRRLAA